MVEDGGRQSQGLVRIGESSVATAFEAKLRGLRERRNDPEYAEKRDARLAEFYECVKCCDEGTIIIRDDDGSYRHTECRDCAPKRRQARIDTLNQHRHRYAELPKRFQQATFESFDTSDDDVLKHAWTVARNFAAGVKSRPWLSLLSNGPGTGKSHLAAAIANYRIEDHSQPPVKWLGVPWWLNRLRQGFRDGTYDELLDDAMRAPCLILDDFGAEYHRNRRDNAESWAAEQLYLLINERYENETETIFTSNVSLDKLPFRLASRISDVATGLVQPVVMETRDYRRGG